MRLFYLLSFLTFMAPEFAHARLKVNVDCFLPNAQISCDDLKQSYFSSMTFVEAVNEASAELMIIIRSLQVTDGTQYQFHFLTANNVELPDFEIYDSISSLIGSENSFVRVLGDLQKGTAPFLALKEAGHTSDGVLTLSLVDPDAITGPTPPTGSTSIPWYFSVSASGRLSDSEGGTSSLSLNGGATTTFSDPQWKFTGSVYGNYAAYSVPISETETLNAVTTSFGAITLVARTIQGSWSVAALLAGNSSTSTNLDQQYAGGVGVEWNLVPFIQTNEKTIVVRYLVGGVYEDYVVPNVLDLDQMAYFSHLAQIALAWHFNSVDVSIGASGSSKIDDLDFAKVSGEGSLTWRATEQLRFSLSGSVSWQSGKTSEPAEVDYSNPLLTYFSGSSYSPLTYTGNLSVTYIFGNSTVVYQDQRWNNLPF